MSEILLKKFGRNLNTRALADSIFTLNENTDSLVVDFGGIESATPSFCHEMLIILKKQRVKFSITNPSEGVKLQIRKAIGSLES